MSKLIKTLHNKKKKSSRVSDSYWQPTAAAASSEKKEEVDASTVVVQAPSGKVLRNAFSQAKLRPIKASLFSTPITTVSAANTTLTAATDIILSSSQFGEYTAWAGVYDECRVLGIKLYYQMYTSVVGSSSLPGVMGLSFDATASSTSTMADAMARAHNTGPRWVTSSTTQYPLNNVTTIHEPLSIRTPGPLELLTSTDCPGNAWFSLETSFPTICVVDQYVGPLGGSGVSACYFFVELECEFKFRV